MTIRHVTDSLGDLLVRGENDPQRRAAVAHLAVCGACSVAWDEHAALFQQLGESSGLAAPSEEALAATAAAVQREGFAPRPIGRRIVVVLSLVVAVLGLGPVLAVAARAPAASGGVAAVLALFAASLAGLSLVRPQVAVLVPGLSLGVALAFGRAFQLDFDVPHSFKCLRLELAFAAIPTIFFFVGQRGPRRVLSPGLAAAGLAGAGALAGQAVLHLLCPMETSLAHQLLFHVLPVLVAMTAAGLFALRRNRRTAVWS